MPSNRLLYVGTLIVAASASIWLGAELTRRIEWITPWTGGLGALLILLGLAQEARRRREAALAPTARPEPPSQR
jgi:hypothetical protein